LGASAGQRFPESPELLGALNGEVRFAIEKPRSKPFSKGPIDEWSETYVPISDGQSGIVGVIGVIQPTLTFREEVRSQFHRLVLPVGIFMFVGYGALVVLLHLLMAPKLEVPSAATNSALPYSAKSQAPVPSAQSR
jgi:hypothetical protein